MMYILGKLFQGKVFELVLVSDPTRMVIILPDGILVQIVISTGDAIK